MSAFSNPLIAYMWDVVPNLCTIRVIRELQSTLEARVEQIVLSIEEQAQPEIIPNLGSVNT